jgi:DNA-binding NarL/FixJ family response regulator
VLVCSRIRLFGESLVRCLELLDAVEQASFYRSVEGREGDLMALAPHLALLDMGADSLLEEALAISRACPEARLLALAVPEAIDEVIACADAGFDGYLSRDSSLEELWGAMQRALRGECACPPQIAGSLMREVRRRRPPAEAVALPEALTYRESEILRLVARGLSNKEVAVQLVVSVATVKNHLYNAFRKLRVRSRTEALARVRMAPALLQAAGCGREMFSATGSG